MTDTDFICKQEGQPDPKQAMSLTRQHKWRSGRPTTDEAGVPLWTQGKETVLGGKRFPNWRCKGTTSSPEEILWETFSAGTCGTLSGMLRVKKILGKVTLRFYWPGVHSRVKDYCASKGPSGTIRKVWSQVPVYSGDNGLCHVVPEASPLHLNTAANIITEMMKVFEWVRILKDSDWLGGQLYITVNGENCVTSGRSRP